VSLELRPRVDDPLFLWRVADVPAASHPTVAAALARVAGTRADDVVWDPFAGSGVELVERARAGKYAQLIGSDRDPSALDAARANCAAADLADVTLLVGDALAVAPAGVTLVLTNPPLGRRALRDADLGDLYDRFLAHVAQLLRPGGRLVWLSPLGARTATRATEVGLRVTVERRVDLGGVHATLQRLDRD
jgi:23S rRNA G2445 N2-methylase RlmL